MPMAAASRRRPENVAGAFYVDSSCIDCGTCWQWDPRHFEESGSMARVWAQPTTTGETERALLAVQACPVAAIGSTPALIRQTPRHGFPALITRHPAGDVYYCGWASRRSFGASSFLVVRPEGNVLVDSPRFNRPLQQAMTKLGGVAAMVLSHRDDVADHQQWAAAFACPRWIHHGDADAVPNAEHVVKGTEAVQLGAALQLIPTPGHTAGSMVMVLGTAGSSGAGQLLFSGDHLWWSNRRHTLVASETYCWWSWPQQLRSVARLRELDVRWLLPGHGDRHRFATGEWRREIDHILIRYR